MNKQPSFTMIELLVVLVLLGIGTAMFFSRLSNKKPNVEWPFIQQDIEKLISFTRQEAMSWQRVYRLVFQHQEKDLDSIRIEEENISPEDPGKKIYKPIISYFFQKDFQLPKEVRIFAVYLGKENLLDNRATTGFCYIEPSGMIQEVYIQLTRKIEQFEGKATLKIDPFMGSCQFFDGLVKP